jgi:hypothetical protein
MIIPKNLVKNPAIGSTSFACIVRGVNEALEIVAAKGYTIETAGYLKLPEAINGRLELVSGPFMYIFNPEGLEIATYSDDLKALMIHKEPRTWGNSLKASLS